MCICKHLKCVNNFYPFDARVAQGRHLIAKVFKTSVLNPRPVIRVQTICSIDSTDTIVSFSYHRAILTWIYNITIMYSSAAKSVW